MKTANNEFDNGKLDVSHNHMERNFGPKTYETAVYVGVTKRSETVTAVLSLTEAQELIEVLQAIVDDYEKQPTNEDILNELPLGSVVQFNEEKSRWSKSVNGWLNARTGTVMVDTSIFEDFTITVKYRGDE